VSPDSSLLLSDYLVLYLRSDEGQEAIAAVKGANTTKQTELGKTKLEALSIPMPSIDFQMAVVGRAERFLARTQQLATLGAHAQSLVAALKESALNRAFEGIG
jgi:type I restriction enzyme S subunit